MGESKKNKPNKEAKVIPLYPEADSSENNGSFMCPAVALLQSLTVQVKSLQQLIANKNENSSAMLDNSDLLREYKISRGTAVKWRNEGLAFTKIGSKIYYKRENIEKFLQQYNVEEF